MNPSIVLSRNEQFYAIESKLEAPKSFPECKPVVLHLYIINLW